MSFSSNGVSWSAAEPYGTTKSWTLADGEGFRTAYVKYQDAAGNWTNEPISRGIVVDKTAPSRPTGVAASPSGNNRVNVSWTASTDATGVTGYTLYRDGQLLGTVTITGYTDQSVLPGHTYSYTVTARDAVGNVSPPSDLVTAAVPWGDSVPPTTTLALSPDPGAGWANQSVTVVLSSSDGTDGSGVRQISYSLDGWSTSNTYTQPFSVGEGVTTVSYRAEDNAGNLETSNTSPAIRVDLQPPSGTVAINGGATLTNSFGVSLSLSAEDTGSGVTHMRFSSDGSSWTTAESFAGSRSWTLPAGDGSHSVHLQLRDAAGNWSAGSISSAIVVDATPPTTPTGVTATSPDGVSVSVGWQASSDATGVTGYRVYRGGALLGESTSTGYTDNDVSSGNSYSYTVRSVDSAGNLSLPSVSAAIALATDAPVLDLAMTGNLVDPLPGETVRLQVTYRNNSATDAVDVTISCPLPDATTYVDGSATAGGVFDAGSGVVRWALSSVPVGATGHFYFEVTVD
ncbi:MAG: DUF11 domain-containing protein [Veillonellaceae bacterium]|nr:DUF11 domain-containing protein [Veillonellaceae bacterium]